MEKMVYKRKTSLGVVMDTIDKKNKEIIKLQEDIENKNFVIRYLTRLAAKKKSYRNEIARVKESLDAIGHQIDGVTRYLTFLYEIRDEIISKGDTKTEVDVESEEIEKIVCNTDLPEIESDGTEEDGAQDGNTEDIESGGDNK